MSRNVVCALVLLASVACARKEPAVFGRACVDDGACDVDNGLVCDPLRHQCAPPREPPPIPGLTCDDAHVIELSSVNDLYVGSKEVELGREATTSPAGAACAGDDARWVYARVAVPTAMAARVVAAGQGKVSVAVLGAACEPILDHACAAGSDVTLPLVEGDVTLAVSASAGDTVTITFEQVRCPAGFVPTETGCLGFLDVVAPLARIGHQLTVVDDDVTVASGGQDADGAPVVSQVFSRRALRWRDLVDGDDRFGHAAAATDGFFFAVGGNAERASEVLEPNTTLLSTSGEPVEAQGIANGTLTRLTSDVPLLFVGGVDPVVSLFDDVPFSCDSAGDCPATFQCVAVFENTFGADPVGICLCVADDCNRLVRENFTWVDIDGPDHLQFRQRHIAVDLADDPQQALVLVTGGVANDADIAGGDVPRSYVLLADTLTWVQMPVDAAPRRDGIGASIGSGDVILVGGRGSDEAPLDLVELWAPLLASPPRVAHLARARADLTGALLGAPGVADTFIVIGGDDGNGPLASTELIDVVTGSTRVGPALPFPLSGARAALLDGGEVLVVGGRSVDGALTETALLLSEIAPTLVKPDIGEGVPLPETKGDFCEDALLIEGESGSIEGTTVGFQDNLDLINDQGCNGVSFSRGLDIFFQLDVPAAATVHLELVDPVSGADLVLAVYDSCPLQFPCIDGADIEVQTTEELTIDVDQATSLFVLVDGFIEDAPYNYRLRWTVTGTPP